MTAFQTVTPAQRRGAAASRESPSGMGVTCRAKETAYCWKDPCSVKPGEWIKGEGGSEVRWSDYCHVMNIQG